DFAHFLANIVPLTVLVTVLGHLMPGRFWWVIGALTLGTGAAVWLLARRHNHLGASGLIYALLGYLTLHGFLANDWFALAISAGLLLLYSGLLWGALPTTTRTSWESHLFGLGVGLALAWFHLV
ncbi:MAG TPA: rhomboid family intramembrane serine protease, partial [Moraxellaceae bacterium]|nr:rhomboid family intramembrane serine protease [Moraxellaceae bacterium]